MDPSKSTRSNLCSALEFIKGRIKEPVLIETFWNFNLVNGVAENITDLLNETDRSSWIELLGNVLKELRKCCDSPTFSDTEK